MSFVYIKIENLLHKGNDLYYQNPITTTLKPAHNFNDKYTYYYKALDASSNMIFLDKYIKCELYDLGENEEEVYEFSNKSIPKYEQNNIYCKGISEDIKDFELIKDISYMSLPVYYKKIRK